jgi:DNA-binding phage protein
MAASGSAFWDDLGRDLEDPEYRRQFILEAQRIATIDRVVNALRGAGETAGLPKQAVAEAARMSAPALRRLLSAPMVNPTLSTLSDVAAAVGLKVALVPMTAEERRTVTDQLVGDAVSRPTAGGSGGRGARTARPAGSPAPAPAAAMESKPRSVDAPPT